MVGKSVVLLGVLLACSLHATSLFNLDGLQLRTPTPKYTVQLVRSIKLIKDKLLFKFESSKLKGKLYFGFYPYGSNPIIFKHPVEIKQGQATINLKKIYKSPYRVKPNGRIDRLFYRVINQKGRILFESRLGLKQNKKGLFTRVPIITSGPFVTHPAAGIMGLSFTTDQSIRVIASLERGQSNIVSSGRKHEIIFTQIKPNHRYHYRLEMPEHVFRGELKTFAGAKVKKFSFGFISDSRGGFGGGEREYLGTNYYVMRRVAALSNFLDLPFMLFIGDMVSGYENSPRRMNLEYWNWKQSVEMYGQSHPIFLTQGNHEVMFDAYKTDNPHRDIRLPKSNLLQSSESIFAANFMLPTNGPISEDNSWADSNPQAIDFPSYKENVYSFAYGNSAFIVMNSNYWFTPHFRDTKRFGGNPHGYIMDNQLKWFVRQMQQFNRNRQIKHIFIAFHTPIFPNGGHAKNDMWYKGNNKIRPYANGKPARFGIIERRDQLLQIIDRSKKVVAVLTGDEHNFSLLKIGPKIPMYPKNYRGRQIKLRHSFWQITNGTAGAPYYAQEKLPWSKFVKEFTSEHVLSVFKVRGKKVFLESINPLTLKTLSKIRLR